MLRIVLILCLSILFFPIPTIASVVNRSPVSRITSGLIGYWTFDASDMINNVTDRSGQGNHGFMQNFTSTSSVQTLGKVGQAVTCDGVNDRILLNGVTITDTYTISLWMKPQPASKNFETLFANSGGTVGLFYNGFNQKLNNWYSSTNHVNNTALIVGAWTHVVVASTAGSFTFYVNGVADGTGTGALGFTGINICDDGASEQFAGSLDDFRVYNRALTSSEINALYTMGTPSTVNKSPTSRLSSGLIGLWTLDGPNLLSNAKDSSTTGNNGYLQNFTSTSSAQATGKIGQALKFDGIDDYVEINDVGAYDNIGALTVSVWVKPNVLPTTFGGAIVSKTRSSSGFDGWIIYRNGSGNYEFTVNNTTAVSDSAFSDTKWHHIVGVYNGSNVRIYVDGIDADSTPPSLTGTLTDTRPICIGTSQVGSPACTNFIQEPMTIDEVRVYNRALSQSEVTTLYTIGTPSTANANTNSRQTSGLVGLWSFDGPDMLTNVRDRSGNGNHAFMQNFTSTSSAQTPGKIGQALKFDGVDDSVSTGNDLIGTGADTISAWVYPLPSAVASRVVSNGVTQMWVAGTAQLLFSSDGSTAFQCSGTTNDFVYGTWSLFTITRASNGSAVCYVNGVSIGSGSSGTPGAGSALTFGDYSNNAGYAFNGRIDDVRIYNRQLSSTEVQNLYNLGR